MKALYDVVHVRTLFHINDDVALYAMLAKTENAAEKKWKFQQIKNILLKNPFDLIKKMNTHTLCFCPPIGKFIGIENLKSAQEGQRK